MPRNGRRRHDVAIHQERPRDEALIPRERDLLTGHRAVVDRDEKHDSGRSEDPARIDLDSRPPMRVAAKARRRLARWQVVAAAGAAVVVLGGLGFAAASGGLLAPGAGGSPGGGDGTEGSGSSDGSDGSAGSGRGVAPAVDPALIVGYAMTLTRQSFETASDQEVPGSEAAGAVREWSWMCEEGLCTSGDFSFRAAAATVAVTLTDTSSVLEGSPCAPITHSLDLVRADDGTYSGTMSVDPAQLEGRWEADGVIGRCSAPRTVDSVVLVPILAQTPSTSGADGGDVIDLAGIDACSLLSVVDVQTLTSEPSEFDMNSLSSGPNEAGCFWAVPKAGFPAYVELDAYRSDGSFGPLFVNDVECNATPMDPAAMGGALAEGATCPGKAFLRAFDRGFMVSVQVNEPNGPLSPADLIPTVLSVLDQL